MSDGSSYLHLNKSAYAWKPDINYREHPQLYRVRKSEQDVLICEPDKTEIGINWRFKTKALAEVSAEKIFQQSLMYLKSNDFDSADMARKYLQMGFTRARRQANYKGGKKYDANSNYDLLTRGTGEREKEEAAKVFFDQWKIAEDNEQYSFLKSKWEKEKG